MWAVRSHPNGTAVCATSWTLRSRAGVPLPAYPSSASPGSTAYRQPGPRRRGSGKLAALNGPEDVAGRSVEPGVGTPGVAVWPGVLEGVAAVVGEESFCGPAPVEGFDPSALQPAATDIAAHSTTAAIGCATSQVTGSG